MSDWTWKQKWLAIAPKPFAVLSILGSLYISRQILRSPRRRGEVLSRILLGLSLYDVSTSTALFMGTWPIPAGTPGVYMASGTDATCSAHGFFVQMGVGTPLYNASLATYYYLAVRLGWNERRLRRAEPFLHFVPIAFSFSSAIFSAAKGLYANSNLWCWVNTSQNSAYRLAFMYGPVWAAVVVITLEMGAISAHVFLNERRRRNYGEEQVRRSSIASGRSGGGTPRSSVGAADARRKDSTTRRVATQALFYVFAFYWTWLFPSWTRMSQMIHGKSPFWPIAMFCISYPMQGFLNFLVYSRPRYLKYRREHPEQTVGQVLRNIRRSSFASAVSRPPSVGNSPEPSRRRGSGEIDLPASKAPDEERCDDSATLPVASEPSARRGSGETDVPVSKAPDEERCDEE